MLSNGLLKLCEAFPEGYSFLQKDEVSSLSVIEKVVRVQTWFQQKATIKIVSKVKMLLLSHKGIDGLPSEIGLFKNLRWLDVSSNKLTSFPPALLKLKKIRHLMCRNNCFLSQPVDRKKFPQLDSFWY